MEILVEQEYDCPHCGEAVRSLVDTSQREHFLVEDCSVCCAPITLRIRCSPGIVEAIEAEAE